MGRLPIENCCKAGQPEPQGTGQPLEVREQCLKDALGSLEIPKLGSLHLPCQDPSPSQETAAGLPHIPFSMSDLGLGSDTSRESGSKSEQFLT